MSVVRNLYHEICFYNRCSDIQFKLLAILNMFNQNNEYNLVLLYSSKIIVTIFKSFCRLARNLAHMKNY